MLSRAGRAAREWAAGGEPWTNVVGAARTMMALGTALTFAFSHSTSLFRPTVGVPLAPVCHDVSKAALFCVVPSDRLEVVRWVVVALLLVIASGWRPRYTGVLHWYINFSFVTTAILVDGGDQIAAILTLLLIPVTLTDPRKWHWQRPAEAASERRRLVALSALWMVRLQMAGIYFHASIGKFPVQEWADGTAVYYWFSDPSFGLAPWLRPLGMPLLANPLAVTALTWGALLLETFLFAALVMEPRHRKKMLALGILFHFGIALVHGLITFALVMWAGLVLFLWPVREEWKWLYALEARLRRWAPRALPAPAPAPLPVPAAAAVAAGPAAG
ncbi:MAG TPA: sporulation-delaying protein SdpB family protein [Longimicrobium sp.]|nr:sporulation-delaying protein SdpB family protein [Longimicrobium sp.]